MSWRTVLGFEIHVELTRGSKMFCSCSANHFGKPPNSQVCPVWLGLPGALPVPNAQAIEDCIKLGLALNCQINLLSKFDRKNYFYPDLPKGYQISQYDQPLCHSGSLSLASGKIIGITRVHLEEDTGKLQHQGQETLIDFNRSGVPLVEIVTAPDFTNTLESDEFLKEIQAIVRALGISTADMEKGSMRLEANISLAPVGSTEFPNYRVEIKNVNSFRFVKKAIESEIQRQTQNPSQRRQESRRYDEKTNTTVLMRWKEEANDYRYFPEPDIPPLEFTSDQIESWKKALPELPAQQRQKLISLGVPFASAATIVDSSARFARFIELSKDNDPLAVAKVVANTPEDKLGSLSLAKPNLVVDEDKIKEVATKVIEANPKAVADYKAGKQQALFFIIGQIKKQLPEVNIALTQEIINEII